MTKETDRELMELAAKAANVFLTPEQFAKECASPWEPSMEPFYDERRGVMTGYRTWYGSDGEIVGWEHFDWSPLTDDGDAFRLAVKLGIKLELNPAWVYARAVITKYEYLQIEEGWANGFNDPCAATRRAIVRAAAEIGRAMP